MPVLRKVAPQLLALVIVAGCAIGPNYKRPEVEAAPEWRAPSASEDSARTFFDSLASGKNLIAPPAAAAADTPSGAATVRRPDWRATYELRALDAKTGLSWAALIKDSALQALIDTAVHNNRDVRVAIATINEFRAEYGVSKGALFPQINGVVNAGREKIVLVPGQSEAFNAIQVTANLQWELDFWGRLRRNTQAARAEYLASEEGRRSVILTLVSDVATAYLQLRELDLDLEISQRTLVSRQETLKLALRRYQQGLISELDVRQFESDVDNSAVAIADFQRRIAQQENALSVLVGHAPAPIARGQSLTDVLGTFVLPTELPADLIARRPDVRQAEEAFVAANARIGAAQAALFPAVTVSSQYGRQGDKFNDTFKSNGEIYQIFGGLSIPLFRGGALRSELSAARARSEQARFAYEQAVLVARREAEDAFVGVRTSRDQAVAQQRQVDALRRAFDLANRRYQNGVSSYLEVLDAQRNLFTSELALTQAQRLELVSGVQLYKALGGAWSEDSVAR
ncbi:MAG: efflux transporter outer membrane subunit [Gemmatimonadota bacterium]|nr:efflux transporter outer membrane subunit [Gemmatimonadota bacterium]